MFSTRGTLLTLLLLLTSACRGIPEARSFEADTVYQGIANVLPEVSVGLAEPPAVVYLARTNKLPPSTPAEQLVLSANEEAFFVRINTLVPRRYRVPYKAIEDLDYIFPPFNAVFYLVPFIQTWRTRLVIDAKLVPELWRDLNSDLKTLRAIAQEVGLPAPYYYAEDLANTMADWEAEWGPDRIVLRWSSTKPIPPFIPVAGYNRTLAEYFRWARDQGPREASKP